jgi:hypothetical protein
MIIGATIISTNSLCAKQLLKREQLLKRGCSHFPAGIVCDRNPAQISTWCCMGIPWGMVHETTRRGFHNVE